MTVVISREKLLLGMLEEVVSKQGPYAQELEMDVGDSRILVRMSRVGCEPTEPRVHRDDGRYTTAIDEIAFQASRIAGEDPSEALRLLSGLAGLGFGIASRALVKTESADDKVGPDGLTHAQRCDMARGK